MPTEHPLVAYCRLRGWTGRELAKNLKIPPAQLSHIVHGRRRMSRAVRGRWAALQGETSVPIDAE